MSTTITMKSLKKDIYSAYLAEKEISASYKSLAKKEIRAQAQTSQPNASFAVFGDSVIHLFNDAIAAVSFCKELDQKQPQTQHIVKQGKFQMSSTGKSVQRPAGSSIKTIYMTPSA